MALLQARTVQGVPALFSSRSVHHCTPREVLAPVRLLAEGLIGLDPCSNPRSIVGAREEWVARGGLRRPWHGYGLVYCNPPYGRAIGRWTERCVESAHLGTNVVGLLPARTDTSWWQRDVQRAGLVCFWRGRIKFQGSKSGAPFPSALVFWGDRAFILRAGEIFRGRGVLVTPHGAEQ
jgi:hypothetical protein